MIKIEIKNRFTGSVIFEYTKENNTIKETIEEAVKVRANLYGANLDGANLVRANLNGANLVRANLVRANLDGANLVRANLVRANLDGANLDGAIKTPMYCKWGHGITGGEIHIGCEKRTIEEWDLFFNSEDELETNRDTKEFKQIQAVFEAYKAYLNFLNDGK